MEQSVPTVPVVQLGHALEYAGRPVVSLNSLLADIAADVVHVLLQVARLRLSGSRRVHSSVENPVEPEITASTLLMSFVHIIIRPCTLRYHVGNKHDKRVPNPAKGHGSDTT